MEQLQEFYGMLPPELQDKIAMLHPEEQQQILVELMQRYQDSQSEYAQMGANPQGQRVPVEAERNETITVQDGEQPQVEGGYLQKLSENPVTGQATYEIPDNQHNNTHEQIGNGSANTGVNMQLKEGDVVNSDKTKIPANMIIMGRNFKGKTFKEASDYISKKENEIQKSYKKNIDKGKVDKVSENSVTLMLAKLGNHRNQLNELQELALEYKQGKEENMRMGGAVYAKFGMNNGDRVPYTLNFQMPNLKYDNLSGGKQSAKLGDNVKDRMVNTYHAPYPVIQAQDGFNTSYEKFKNFVKMVEDDPNATAQDMGSYGRLAGFSGYGSEPKSISLDSTDIEPGKVSSPPKKILNKILTSSTDSGLDPAMMLAFADIESGFKSNAISSTGATGIFQFTKGTAEDYGLFQDGKDKRFDPDANIEAAMKLTQNNIKRLQKNGIEINPTNIYLAHQIGIGGVIDIYNNIKTGQPLSKQTKDNMGVNFGTKTALDYIADAQKKIMSRYKSFQSNLAKLQENNDYKAFDLKQKYSLGEPVSDISNELLRSGEDNVMKRLRTGNFTITTPQINNQPTPEDLYPDMPKEGQDMPQEGSYERFGGAIKAQVGLRLDPRDNAPAIRQDYLDVPGYENVFRYEHPKAVDATRPLNIPEDDRGALRWKNALTLDYLLKGDFFQKPYIPIVRRKQETQQPEQTEDQDGLNYEGVPYIPEVVIYADRIRKDEKDNGQGITPPVLAGDNKIQSNSLISTTGGPGKGGGSKLPLVSTTTTTDKSKGVTTTTPSGDSEDEDASWWDKFKYGLTETIPFLDAIGLMNEGIISPVLQRKAYFNPYESMSTEYSIQSALNDIDRTTRTAMGDERGNPSVRSARLAQIAANAVASKAPLYEKKYNMEEQMKAQKQIGSMQYLNQWSDANMALAKQYEQEVLKTREVQRQQQYAALAKIQNDIIKKREENRLLDLALMDTVYDYDKYTGKLKLNKKKQAEAYAYRQMVHADNAAEAEKWKKKYLEEIKKKKEEEEVTTKAYGGSIKKRKPLSLKSYK